MGFKKFTKLGSGGTLRTASESLRAAAPLRTGSPPLSVDFGVGSLKVLQISGSEPPALVAAACLDVPEEVQDDAARRIRFQLDALPKLIKQGGFRSVRAVCSIPAGQMFCKHLQVQKAEGIERGEIARAAIAKQLECDPTSLVCRHVEAKELPGGRSEVICFAASRGLVGQMMATLKQARLEPVGIHCEAQAIVRACRPQVEAEPVPTLFLDIGRGTTSVVVAKGEQVQFSRVVTFGGLHLDQAVSHQLKCTMGRANERRLELDRLVPEGARVVGPTPMDVRAEADGAEPQGATLTRATLRPIMPEVDLSEALEVLTDEISMCLRYHRSLFPDQPVQRAVFVGGETRQRALCEHIARVLRLPSETADPMARVARTGKEPTTGLDISQPQPGWAVALGMCLSPTDL